MRDDSDGLARAEAAALIISKMTPKERERYLAARNLGIG